MAKQGKVIKEVSSNLITIRKTIYLRLPSDIVSDSSFPFKFGIRLPSLKIKMLKNKLIIEEVK